MAQTPLDRPVDRQVQADLSSIAFPSLNLERSTADQIYQALKAAILATKLPPGCLISEQEIGLRFGASRTPVREAFQRLRGEGLIVTLPSRGNFVSRLSEHRIREAQYIREALELANVRRLCEAVLSEKIADALHETLAAQEQAIAEGDDVRFQEQDDLFHALIARASGYERAESLLFQEKSSLDRLRVFSLHEAHHTTRLLGEHRRVLAAILRQDSTEAEHAMRHHLRSILDFLSGLISENHELFDQDGSSGS